MNANERLSFPDTRGSPFRYARLWADRDRNVIDRRSGRWPRGCNQRFRSATFFPMLFRSKDERSSLALLAGLGEKQASELSDVLSKAADELGDDELVQHVTDRVTSVEGRDVKRILKTVRQIASAREVLEIQPDVFLNDIAEGMGDVEEKELRLDERGRHRLRERLVALTESPVMEIHAKARSMQPDQQNTHCSRKELRRRFEEYADDWKTRTAHLSVLSQRVMHPSYQRIIGLGQDALPLLLERLSTHPDHWFWALRSIAGEDPVNREDVGKFAAMRDAWIRWGRSRGLI